MTAPSRPRSAAGSPTCRGSPPRHASWCSAATTAACGGSASCAGRPFPNDTLDMFMNAAVDAGLVLQAFITAAEALGLGCCPISVVRNHVEKLASSSSCRPASSRWPGICVGYPSSRAGSACGCRRGHRAHRPLRRQRPARPARGLRSPARGAPRHAQGEPALRRALRLHRALRLVGGQGPPVLRRPSATTSARTSAVTASAWPERTREKGSR